MKIAPMGEVRNNFSSYLRASKREAIFVTRNGKVVAVLEHMDDAGIEDYLLARSARFRAMLAKTRREKGGMTLAAYRKSRGI